MAWKVIRRRKLYSAISLFGISITMMFVILVSAFYNEVNSYKSPRSNFKRVLSLPIYHIIYSTNGNVTGNQYTYLSYRVIRDYLKTLNTPELVSASLYSCESVDVYMNHNKSRLKLRYVDSEFWRITDFNFISGRPFNKNEFDKAARIAVIDDHTAELLYGDADPVGKHIKVYGRNYQVCGVIKGVGSVMIRLTGNIYLPITVEPANLINTHTNDFSAFVLAKDKKDFAKIRTEFQQVVKNMELPVTGDYKVEANLDKGLYSVLSLQLPFKSKSTFWAVGITLLTIILLLYLLLPSMSLANINMNRIYERSSEIGVRKAFGANSGIIINQFLAENLFLTFLGSLLGFVIAFITITIVNSTIADIQLRIDLRTLFFGLLVMIIFGLLSGVLPARKMSRMKIVESLREY